MNDHRIFLVRDLNKCEIREINKEFTLIKSFKNIGDEIIAIDIFIRSNIEKNNSEHDINSEKNEKNDILKVRDDEKNINLSNKSSENDIIKENSINKISSINDSERYFDGTIAILDIDGNVNFYENDIISKKFNLYDIKEINNEQKKKMFFSMGYAYYIKCNKNFICISSDHGCYVIKIDYK
jgi:hypothetical protein